MPDLVRAFDWGSTPLGPLDQWSDTLVSNVNQVLFSPIPAILSWGDDFTFFYNEAAIPALQGKHPSALGASYREIYKEVWHLVGKDLEDCYYRGVTVVRENMLIPLLKHGELEDGYFTYYLIPIFEDGKIAGIYDPYQNTTEAVLTARDRDAVAARLGQFLSETTDAVVGVSRDWSISYLNAAGLKTYSTGRELLGKNLWEEFPGALNEGLPFVEHYNRAMYEGIPGSFEAHYGEPLNIWIQLEVYPTPDGFVTFSRDITQQRRAEAALMQAEKLAAVGRLAASIAHEINNPLEAVTNLLYLARTSQNGDEIQDYLASAERELRRVSVISSQTLRFYKQSTRAKVVTCEDLVESVLAIYQGRIINSHVDVHRRIPISHTIECFDGEIRQVLSNLVSNAIDAMHPAGGQLLIRSRKAHNWKTGEAGVVLSVADSGPGMSPEVMQNVFEAFYTTKGIGGTGLGLWVSKEIINRHHGALSLRTSQGVGCSGTVFTVFMPAQAAAR